MAPIQLEPAFLNFAVGCLVVGGRWLADGGGRRLVPVLPTITAVTGRSSLAEQHNQHKSNFF